MKLQRAWVLSVGLALAGAGGSRGSEIPADVRAALEKAAEWTCAAKDDLPIVDVSWDKTALQNSVFDWAGWPDNPDPEKAKGAFLAFDAANAELKGSYKLPFARYENGKLEAVETFKAHELAAMTEERAGQIISMLRLFAPVPRNQFNGEGLVEQQAIFHRRKS